MTIHNIKHDKHVLNSKAAIRLRAIHRLHSIGTALTNYTKRVINQFVEDDEVPIERFRLLVILAGFPVNVLFHLHSDGHMGACESKADIMKRMYTTKGQIEYSVSSTLEPNKTRGGTTDSTNNSTDDINSELSKSIETYRRIQFLAGTSGFLFTTGVPLGLLFKSDILMSCGPLLSFLIISASSHLNQEDVFNFDNFTNLLISKQKNKSFTTNEMKAGAIYWFTIASFLTHCLFNPMNLIQSSENTTSNVVEDNKYTSNKNKLSLTSAKKIQLRDGWELRVDKYSDPVSYYFYHPKSKNRNKHVPIYTDELPHNWVQWLDQSDTNKLLYTNIFTHEEITNKKEMENVIKNGELKYYWKDLGDHMWQPPANSKYYKKTSYNERPLQNDRLEKCYNVIGWEFWDKTTGTTKHTAGDIRYRFIQDGDIDFDTKHYSSEWTIIQEFNRRKINAEDRLINEQNVTEPTKKFATKKPQQVSKKSKSSSNDFVNDISHAYKQIMTPLNLFGLRVVMTTLVTGAVAKGLVKFLSKSMDNRQFAKILAAPKDTLPSVGKDIAIPKIHDYQNTLMRIDYNLHTTFMKCNNDVPSLVTSLLRLRKTREAFYHRRILPYHLIRTNGQIRTSANEMALAIAHHWQWGNLLGIMTTRIRNIGNLAFSRRKPKSKRLTQRQSKRVTHRQLSNHQKKMTRRTTMAGGRLMRYPHTS